MKRLYLSIVVLCVFSGASFGQWQIIATMKDSRANFAATRIGSKVYFCGGRNTINPLSSCEVFDLNSQTFSTIASMNEPRLATQAVVLPDGKIYVPSGLNNLTNLMTTTCEVYDPNLDTWSYTTSLIEARESEAVLLLNNNDVLIAAGALAPNGPYRSTCELYNLNTKQVSFTGSLSTGQFVGPSFLDTMRNKVTLMGGHYNGQHGTWVRTTEEYDIATGIWTVVGSSQVEHGGGNRPAVLPNGDIVVAGGDIDPKGADYAATDLIEIYTPRTHTWRTFGRLRIPRFGGCSAYIGGDSVMVIGGYDPISGFALDDCEVINLKTGAVTAGPKLNQARTGHWFTMTRDVDIENPCTEIFRIYVFAGEATLFSGTLTSCEMIEFRSTKQTTLTIPDSISLSGSVCQEIDSAIALAALTCGQLTVDSVTVEGLPSASIFTSLPAIFSNDSTFTFDIRTRDSITSMHKGFVHVFYHSGVIAHDTLIPVTATFKGTNTTLGVPKTLSYTGTICDGIDTAFTIASNSCSDLIVDSLQFTGIPFSSVSVSTPFTIPSGSPPVSLPISIHSTTPGTANGFIHVWYHSAGVFHDTIIAVTAGLGAASRGTIRAIFNDVIDGRDTIEVPVYLNSNSGEFIDGFDLTLRYNTDLLEPVAPKFSGTLCEGAGLYNLNRLTGGNALFVPFPFSLSSTKPLVILRFKSFVTTTNCTPLILEKLRLAPDDPLFGNCVLAVTNDLATICRLDACGDPTIRRFLRTNSLDGITFAQYDRSSNSIAVGHTFDRGPAQISIFDALGREVEKRDLFLGSSRFVLPANTLSSGVCFLALKQNGHVATGRLIIDK